jgi:hypothetical protein
MNVALSLWKGARGRTHVTATIVLAVMAIMFAAPCSHAQDDAARRLLRTMPDYVTRQDVISIAFDSDVEVITSELQKIQFTSSRQVLLRRPAHLRGMRKSGHAEVEYSFDGTTFTVYDRRNNVFARTNAPGSFDQLVDRLRTDFSIEAPGADLLSANVYDVLTEDMLEAKHLGRGVIDGVECEHLAFRNPEVDWQLWIEAGPRPVPRKYVITSKTVTGAPQYTLRIKEWRSDVPADDASFVFNPPAGAREVDPNVLLEIDEIPVGVVSAVRR